VPLIGQDHSCAAEMMNSKNDSLLKNNRDYVINARKYRKLTQSADHNAMLDSLLRVVAKSDLTETEQEILSDLIRLSGNNVSGDVYSKVEVLDQQLIIKFDRSVSMTWLYRRDSEYAKISKEFNSWASKIDKFIHQSIEYHSADKGILVNDSVFLSEVQAYKFKTGEIIADIGTGSGYFEIVLSKFCDNLQVNAVDIDSVSIAHLATQLKFLDLNDKRNITFNAVLGNEKSSSLPADRFDKVIIRNTFHHFTYPVEMLEDCKRIMKENGRLFIVDILVDEVDRSPACRLHLPRGVFLNYLTNNGFVLTNETNLEYDNFKLFEFQLVP